MAGLTNLEKALSNPKTIAERKILSRKLFRKKSFSRFERKDFKKQQKGICHDDFVINFDKISIFEWKLRLELNDLNNKTL